VWIVVVGVVFSFIIFFSSSWVLLMWLMFRVALLGKEKVSVQERLCSERMREWKRRVDPLLIVEWSLFADGVVVELSLDGEKFYEELDELLEEGLQFDAKLFAFLNGVQYAGGCCVWG
jgi:hypothetical protein